MEQKKIGSFLKELRKEKGITQEEFAEKMKVSARTVSRWETAMNMPDISLLVEISEFYNVSISEIINGERKNEKMNREVKETALKVSDYSKMTLKKRLFRLSIIALAGMIVFVVIEALGLDKPNTLYETIASIGLGLVFGTLMVSVMYFSGILEKIKERRIKKR